MKSHSDIMTYSPPPCCLAAMRNCERSRSVETELEAILKEADRQLSMGDLFVNQH